MKWRDYTGAARALPGLGLHRRRRRAAGERTADLPLTPTTVTVDSHAQLAIRLELGGPLSLANPLPEPRHQLFTGRPPPAAHRRRASLQDDFAAIISERRELVLESLTAQTRDPAQPT